MKRKENKEVRVGGRMRPTDFEKIVNKKFGGSFQLFLDEAVELMKVKEENRIKKFKRMLKNKEALASYQDYEEVDDSDDKVLQQMKEA